MSEETKAGMIQEILGRLASLLRFLVSKKIWIIVGTVYTIFANLKGIDVPLVEEQAVAIQAAVKMTLETVVAVLRAWAAVWPIQNQKKLVIEETIAKNGNGH